MIKRSREWGVPCRLPSLVQFCGVVHNLGEIHLVGSPDQSSSVSLGDQSFLEMYGFTSKFLSPCWLIKLYIAAFFDSSAQVPYFHLK